MRKCDVMTAEGALVYMTSCTLATVSSMAMKKSRQKHEYARQISIAQTGIDWIKDFKITTDETRVNQILVRPDASVAEWARTYEEN